MELGYLGTMNDFELEIESPCPYCLDSGLREYEGSIVTCGECQSGRARKDRRKRHCNKPTEGRVFAVYFRPTVLHYFSRLYLMCKPCFSGFVRYVGMPDHYETIAPSGLRCGSLVSMIERGGEPDFCSTTGPDYIPIEDPRKFGMHLHGGAMKAFYDSLETVSARVEST